MNPKTKPLIIIAAILVIVGGIIATLGVFAGGMQPVSLTSKGLVVGNDQIVVDEHFDKITTVSISSNLLDITLKEGDSFTLSGTYDASQCQLDIKENAGVLTVTCKDRNFLGLNLNFGFIYSDNNLVLTYPRGSKFDEVSVISNLGRLEASDFSSDLFNVDLDMGDFSGSNIDCDKLTLDMDFGSCNIDNIAISDNGTCNLNAGSLSLKNAIINTIDVNLDLGDLNIQGKLSGKNYFDLDAGSLTINTDTLEKDLSYDIKADLGSININNETFGSKIIKSNDSAKCSLEIDVNLGDIRVNAK